jgi:hypothetical protein
MFVDSQLIFSQAQAITASAPSTLTLDFSGAGIGNPPPDYFGIQNATFGEDIGVGDGASPPKAMVTVTTAFIGATSLQIQLQESVDSGSGGAPPYAPNAWKTIAETDALPEALLTLNALIMDFTIPPRQVGQDFPRFFRFNYVVAGGPFTAGAVNANVLTGVDNNPVYPANY